MNKCFLYCLFGLLCCANGAVRSQTWDGTTVARAYAGGNGTKADPYLISNGAELAKLASDVNNTPGFSRGRYFKLTDNIVMNEGVLTKDVNTLMEGNAFAQTPTIGEFLSEQEYTAFQGVFDGDGHTISGVYAQAYITYLALFRVLEDAEVKNLGIVDAFVYGNSHFGAIAARLINSSIINCYVANSYIRGYGSYGGLIAGQMLGTSKIQNCYTQGNIYGKNNIGAIVGRIGNGDMNNALVENCYTTATITLNNRENKAGVTSENAVGSIVRNCFFTADASDMAVWLDNGTTVGCSLLSVETMTSAPFVETLNTNSRSIAGACRWKAGTATPEHDFSTFTPEDAGKRDIAAIATNPLPAHGDMHAAVEGDTPQLCWDAAIDGQTVKQYLYLGTDSTAIANGAPSNATATLQQETTYTTTALSNLNTYYWRVDREDASGQVTPGDVWTFQPRHLAFPGAEGYGRFARGGRGGKIVYVTNLDDDGPGSLRWALTNGQGPRTVLFKVSGIIDMHFRQCLIDDQVTIAGQSAPGKGICLKHCDIGLGSDNVCRFLRARRGLGTPDETGNAIGTVYADHTIIDHVSASWGTDETFSSRSSRNITLQNTIIAEALGIAGHRNYAEGTNHGYAATIGGDVGSFHHNLLADCYGRNWSMGGGTNANGEYAGRLDIFNNVVYNWNSRTTDGGAHKVNFVNNYYKMGLDTRETFLFSLDIEGNLGGTQSAYVGGNLRDDRNGTLTSDSRNQTYRLRIRDGRTSLAWEPFANEPFFPSFATIHPAALAYKRVLSDVGANQPCSDCHDQRMVAETLDRNYTYVGSRSSIKGQIDSEEDCGGFDNYPEETLPVSFDSDYDGLPDWWEEIRGTKPNARTINYKETNLDLEGDGYTELDRYLDFMAQPHLFLKPDETATVNVRDLFTAFTVNPRFEAYCDGTALQLSLTDGVLSVQAASQPAITTIRLNVEDADGDTMERRLCIGITNRLTSAFHQPHIETYSRSASRHDILGRKLPAEATAPAGIYIQEGRKSIGR